MTNHRSTRQLSGLIICLALAATAGSLRTDGSIAAEDAALNHAATELAIPPLPAEQLARYQKYVGLLQPTVKPWIKSQAQLQLKGLNPDLRALTAAIHPRFDGAQATGPTALNDSDISAIVFIVLMQATTDAEGDLQQIMDSVKARNKAKKMVQDILNLLKKEEVNLAGRSRTAPCVTAACVTFQKDLLTLNRVLAQNKQPQITLNSPLTIGQIKSVIQALQNAADSMNMSSEEVQLRLRTALDQRAKFMEVISNVLKKISDTSTSIIANLK